MLPAVPVVFGQAVLDAENGIRLHPLDEQIDHLICSFWSAAFFAALVHQSKAATDAALQKVITVVSMKLTGGHVDSQGRLFARPVPGFLDSLQKHLYGLFIALQA